jgi:uncharacterized protein (DUF1800 family)
MGKQNLLLRVLFFLAAAGVLSGQTIATAAAARFLEQSSWGPTAATIARVQKLGFDAYLDEQFAAQPSSMPDVPANANGVQPVGPIQQQFFLNAATADDQLRQRVAFALSEIFVVSAVKLTTADQILPYLRLLQADAFSSFPQIVRDVTLSPSMGHYLDMVNNDKPSATTGREADENYARELLQLFTIGLYELNDDGGWKLLNGQPIPTYDQSVIQGFARAFTGWTYPPKPGATSASHNPAYFEGQMVAVQANHDTAAKTLLNGTTLAANWTAQQDLDAALNNILAHPNVAPFISRQLIQHLVTGDPQPEYVARVAAAFRMSNGDMKTVIRAILLDPDARAGDQRSQSPRTLFPRDPAPGERLAGQRSSTGHLTEPVLYINRILRALDATVTVDNGLAAQGSAMGQNVFYSPSVFNYFSPGYRIETPSEGAVNAPEFQTLSTSTAMRRVDFLNSLVYKTIAGVTLDWSPYLTLSAGVMVDTLSSSFLHGRMSAQTRASVLKAVNAQTSAKARAQAAVYLIASASEYQVER